MTPYPVNYNPFATSSTDDPVLNSFAAKGRNGDTLLSHTTPGDVVLPVELMTPALMTTLDGILKGQLDRFTVGTASNSINPSTQLPEFYDISQGDATSQAPDASGAYGGSLGGSSDLTASLEAAPATPNSAFGPGLQSVSAVMDPQAPLGNPSYTGIGFIDSRIQSAIDNPATTALNIGVGMIPGVGQIASGYNAIAGLTGLPSIGSMLTGLARDATSQVSGPGTGTAAGMSYDTAAQGYNDPSSNASDMQKARSDMMASLPTTSGTPSFAATNSVASQIISGSSLGGVTTPAPTGAPVSAADLLNGALKWY
jgi:hypothetical protein